jgi:hypothetical protein
LLIVWVIAPTSLSTPGEWLALIVRLVFVALGTWLAYALINHWKSLFELADVLSGSVHYYKLKSPHDREVHRAEQVELIAALAKAQLHAQALGRENALFKLMRSPTLKDQASARVLLGAMRVLDDREASAFLKGQVLTDDRVLWTAYSVEEGIRGMAALAQCRLVAVDKGETAPVPRKVRHAIRAAFDEIVPSKYAIAEREHVTAEGLESFVHVVWRNRHTIPWYAHSLFSKTHVADILVEWITSVGVEIVQVTEDTIIPPRGVK